MKISSSIALIVMAIFFLMTGSIWAQNNKAPIDPFKLTLSQEQSNAASWPSLTATIQNMSPRAVRYSEWYSGYTVHIEYRDLAGEWHNVVQQTPNTILGPPGAHYTERHNSVIVLTTLQPGQSKMETLDLTGFNKITQSGDYRIRASIRLPDPRDKNFDGGDNDFPRPFYDDPSKHAPPIQHPRVIVTSNTILVHIGTVKNREFDNVSLHIKVDPDDHSAVLHLIIKNLSDSKFSYSVGSSETLFKFQVLDHNQRSAALTPYGSKFLMPFSHRNETGVAAGIEIGSGVTLGLEPGAEDAYNIDISKLYELNPGEIYKIEATYVLPTGEDTFIDQTAKVKPQAPIKIVTIHSNTVSIKRTSKGLYIKI